jgi:hypothetical protein
VRRLPPLSFVFLTFELKRETENKIKRRRPPQGVTNFSGGDQTAMAQ